MTTLYDDPFLSLPSEGSILEQPSSGIGMAAPKPTMNDSLRSEYSKMSGPAEIFARIGEFGAGVTGASSPMQARIKDQREQKRLQLEETKGFLDDLDKLTKLTKGMDDASKGSLIETVSAKWEAVQPGYGKAVKAIGARPSLLTGFEKYLPNLPVPIQALIKRNPEEAIKYLGTAEGQKVWNKAADKPAVENALRKLDGVLKGWQLLVPPEVVKKFQQDDVLTDDEIFEMQQYLPETHRFSEEERQAIKNDPTFFVGSKVLYGDKAQEVLADKAKQKNKAKEDKPLSELGKLNDDLKAGKITQAQHDAKVKKLTSGPDGQKAIFDVELKLSDDYRQDTKKFSERRPLFDSVTDYMAQRTEKKTSAGDAALLFAYAKMRDPNDRLAVSETRDLVKLGNIFERFGVSITGILDKGETLPDRVAKDMFAEIRRTFGELNKAQSKVEKNYREKITAYKGDPKRVLGEGLSIPDDQLKPKGDKPKDGEVEARKTIGRVNYVKIKGQWFEER